MRSFVVDTRADSARRLHVATVRVAVVAAWTSTLILVGIAVTLGDRAMLLEALAPLAASLFFTLQVILRRENALYSLGAGIVIVIATFPVVGSADTLLAASLAVVAMSVIASLFITAYRPLFLLAGVVVLTLVPVLWLGRVAGAVAAGLIMAITFLIGAGSFMLIRARAIDVEARFQTLFDRAPVALIEQDWSYATEFVAGLDAGSAEDLRRRLSEDEDLLAEAVSRVVVVRANDAAGELLGTSPDRLTGPLPPERLSATSREMWIDSVVRMWAGDAHPPSLEYETTDFQGRPGLWVEVRTITLGSQKAPRVILGISDVTQSRRRTEQMAELVRAKDEFIATVSHELRTPLTAVVGLLDEVLGADDLGEDERTELLRVVQSQANEISYLVEDLLVGARADIGTVSVTPDVVDLGETARDVCSSLGLEYPVLAEGDRVEAWADPLRVRQILRNLAVNADRYGGRMRRICVRPAGDRMTVEMRDDGTPLSADDAATIFEAYTRAHDRPGVTMSVGLGLAVSRQLARLMGGDLDYHHDGAEGVFRLLLPAAETPTASGPAPVTAVVSDPVS